ncbi:phosphotransferase [Rhodococcus wratislaviensis]|uniref:phosphotransferase n=1 Tax=Rhodococcus wratislaviensis TaxID=44752 RepID=UPI001CED683E
MNFRDRFRDTRPLGARGNLGEGRSSARLSGASRWLHGDLHPANMIVRDRISAGVIDFGEMCAGDPATNLRRLDPSRLPSRRIDTFSDLAIAAGKSQLRLVPGSSTGHADRAAARTGAKDVRRTCASRLQQPRHLPRTDTAAEADSRRPHDAQRGAGASDRAEWLLPEARTAIAIEVVRDRCLSDLHVTRAFMHGDAGADQSIGGNHRRASMTYCSSVAASSSQS